ncbi:hypothetical protein BG015_007255 [Linnemannia schmuckeri]|uniref:Uncharacterized protein n=1 Tax=Linnemannia schmuckeri TaxID=64567 RepID=A0A9P5RZF6_9FUNG|nr:hypothetical protein BG015_007255 [Linnemannia schmuckeri]
MLPPTKFDKVILTDHLSEIKRLEVEEAHWKTFLYLPESTLRHYKKPIFLTQDINHNQNVARLKLYEARHSTIKYLVMVQQRLSRFITEDPQYVKQHRRLATEACLFKLKFLEDECLAYLDDQFSWHMPETVAEMAEVEARRKNINWKALNENRALINMYCAVHKKLLNY